MSVELLTANPGSQAMPQRKKTSVDAAVTSAEKLTKQGKLHVHSAQTLALLADQLPHPDDGVEVVPADAKRVPREPMDSEAKSSRLAGSFGPKPTGLRATTED